MVNPAHAVLCAAASAIVVMAGCSSDEDLGQVPATPTSPSASATHTSTQAPSPTSEVKTPPSNTPPALKVDVVTRGLEHGWDIGFLPDGSALISERPGRISLVTSLEPGADRVTVRADLSDVYVAGEGGLLGLVVHPDFATSRQFTTCQNHQRNGRPVDVRLVTWRLSDDRRVATKVKTLLAGLPTADGGRHSGCRPTIAADGALLVGTGDTAVASYPQDLTNLGGKLLRLDLNTGRPLPDNPFADSSDPNKRLVVTYGHRNVQGVAIRPGTGQIFTAEHGPRVNDEVNLVTFGGNYGWDPSRGGSQSNYDESVPMTDRDRFPDAVRAAWQSGNTTQAICSAAFLDGEQWAGFDGALVITALKGAKLLFLNLDADGAVVSVAIPKETNDAYGRLRAARLGPDGALYVTTTNGDDDALLRITPKS